MRQNLIGESPSFLSVLDKVSRLAPIERPVLIIGERGTGKELIAQRLHYLSRRWEQSLVSLNCATLSEGLIDSELFGHESGAFTGAKGRHQGRFERAEGGTLFLDELATAPLSVQEKLLRVIEYGQYERVGGQKTLNTNVRLVCATNANLPQLAKEGAFRADLLDRLAFDVIHIPPLRHRVEDISLLAEHYAIKMCQELEREYFPGFSNQAMQALVSYSWPGNVRELKNVIERAIYQHNSLDEPIDELTFDPFSCDWADHIDSDTHETGSSSNEEFSATKIGADSNENNDALLASDTTNGKLVESGDSVSSVKFPIDYKNWQESQDIALLTKALKEAQFNQRKAAELMGLSYHQLRGMVRKYELIGQNDQ
ncbi:phage shock protein operon transcriptional activator [Vibrio sp. 10N.261.55.A7]|uniref:phage shock protein operon transcriptional activator n=1 Tax=Vibrio sp. 10N.261.55.A7 TaxID=1880851 RepID=UPI000C841643|nr:phage shock protein operon transcriptional activator [Vibrio sp. 10N.261.55.A7]PMK01672.1 phage shock protein operon transcriptional activator [Vibrio sp. 10N.261.55.A7]